MNEKLQKSRSNAAKGFSGERFKKEKTQKQKEIFFCSYDNKHFLFKYKNVQIEMLGHNCAFILTEGCI